MTSNSATALRDIFASARPLVEQQLEVTRQMNMLFMAAWDAGELGKFWTEYRHQHPRATLHYFMRARGFGDIKIGKTKDIDTRFRTIFTCLPRGLDLVACYAAPPEHETELHRMFDRSRLCGEWFRMDEDVADYLEDIGCDFERFTNRLPPRWLSR